MQSTAKELKGVSRAGQRAALLLPLHTPTTLPGQGVQFLPATASRQLAFPHPADSQREKRKKLHNSERKKEGKHRQGQTAVGFNFMTCQHCFSSSFCSSFLQIVDWAYKQGLASWYPEPADKETFVKQHMYSSDYDSFVFDDYRWPPAAMQTQKV